ncbi:MAG TPA: multiubiquitin domain-containing protein [Caulobacteraceae bacterium]|jgi:hypothetical protein
MVEGDQHDAHEPESTPDDNERQEHKFNITIDRGEYVVTRKLMTGEELRHVPHPPIGPDRDLFEIITGGSDKKIEDDEIVEIKNGMRFITAPAHINPG